MKLLPDLSLPVKADINDPQPLILYHGRNCPDGYGAALAAWLFFSGNAEFRGLDHGEIQTVDDLGPLAGRTIYILDFAFGPELLAAIEAQAHKLVLLDHHKSAAEKLNGYQCTCGVVHFDMNKSGARLAWEFFFPKDPIPALVLHIEDRDIWRWQYPESGAFLAALDMEPRSFERWAEIAAFSPEQLSAFMARGGAMDEKYLKLCSDIAEGAQPLVFNGVAGLMVNAPGMFHSQVGDILAKQSGTFALMWSASPKGAKCGLRSRSDFNCIPLAESMGGGGHAQACGFRMGVDRLPELLAGSLTARPEDALPPPRPAPAAVPTPVPTGTP
ncbi:MAG: phosphoesterase [Comamonas sp.]|nr:phosphoesterase [Comamonas sp.]